MAGLAHSNKTKMMRHASSCAFRGHALPAGAPLLPTSTTHASTRGGRASGSWPAAPSHTSIKWHCSEPSTSLCTVIRQQFSVAFGRTTVKPPSISGSATGRHTSARHLFPCTVQRPRIELRLILTQCTCQHRNKVRSGRLESLRVPSCA